MNNKIAYTYTDIKGLPLYRQIRVQKEDEKTFYSEKFVDGKWIKGLEGIDRVLYYLPEVTKAVKNNEKIYFVEGEKDVETLRNKNLVATTIARTAQNRSGYKGTQTL